MTRPYTRTGDDGTTGLLGPQRVSKDDTRIEAIGAVDELNAAIGIALAAQRHRAVREALMALQDYLFTVGADLARPGTGTGGRIPRVLQTHVDRVEEIVDTLKVPTLREFLLPRGSEALARLHWARTVARRAERRAVGLARVSDVNPLVLVFLNRLSSALYQMAVWVQTKERRPREHPTYGRR